MSYFVYLIISKKNSRILSYVGYSNNLAKRVELHNKGKGAKYTRGKKWKLIYKKKYNSKHTAMVEEYKLKKNHKLRNLIKLNYKKKFNNNI